MRFCTSGKVFYLKDLVILVDTMNTMSEDVQHLIWDKCALCIYKTCKDAYKCHRDTFCRALNIFMAWRMISNIYRAMCRSVSRDNSIVSTTAMDRFDRQYKLIPLSSLYDKYEFNYKNVAYMLFKWHCGVAVRLRRYSDEFTDEESNA